jgi:hypothetical protein
MSTEQRNTLIKAALIASVEGVTADQVAEAAREESATIEVKAGDRAGIYIKSPGPSWVQFVKHEH